MMLDLKLEINWGTALIVSCILKTRSKFQYLCQTKIYRNLDLRRLRRVTKNSLAVRRLGIAILYARYDDFTRNLPYLWESLKNKISVRKICDNPNLGASPSFLQNLGLSFFTNSRQLYLVLLVLACKLIPIFTNLNCIFCNFSS